MKIFRNLGALALCQFKAPLLMIDIPSWKKLTLSKIEVREAEIIDEDYDFLLPSEKKRMPKRLLLDGYNEKNSPFHLGINLENETIASASWGSLIGYSQDNSGDIGTFIFGLPSIFLTSPFWLSYNLFWAAYHKVSGMDMHETFLFHKLELQIPTEWREIVRRALKKHSCSKE